VAKGGQLRVSEGIMAVNWERETLGRARLSFADQADIDEFVTVLGRFERGDISSDEWRAFRLVRGTYGQRQAEDAQMLRVKIPQGILTAPQIEALADVAEWYSRGFGHITTRQNLQFHFVRLHDVEPAMRRLADTGLTTREACGNSVRNITACPYAGVAHDEIFDVTPYAEALTRYLLRHPLSSTLPRKFKIGFEGCPTDHIRTAINDLGWCARVETIDGREVRGFRVTLGGGTAILCRSGHVFHEFLPATEMLNLAEAVLRVFKRLGDYTHRQRNRMKFLIQSLGWDRFRADVEQSLEEVRAEGGAALPFDAERPDVEEAIEPSGYASAPGVIAARVRAQTLTGPGIHPEVTPNLAVQDDDFLRWLGTNVRPQRQDGYVMAVARLPLGDITAAQLRVLADLAGAYADGALRVTPEQNALFRWVPRRGVQGLYRRLAAAGLDRAGAGTLADVTSCPGAESCRLAVTQSRGLARVLADHLDARPDLAAAVPGLDIKISGCPNGCGLHHVAGIGFQGSLRKVGGRPAPHYFVMVGGGVNGHASFGRHAATIPVHRGVEALERLIALYRDHHVPEESALEFFQRVSVADVKAALSGLEKLTPEAADPQDFVDLAETADFRPEVMDGECSA
jgi:sulfite reductase (NADPH) hemoprotein beta-component